MSYRSTVITNYIYQAGDEVKEANDNVRYIFEKWLGSGLVSKVDEVGYGFYAGIFKGLHPEEYQNDLTEIIPKLEKATKVAFKLIVTTEDGTVIINEIKPV